jgi:hypothetical protein
LETTSVTLQKTKRAPVAARIGHPYDVPPLPPARHGQHAHEQAEFFGGRGSVLVSATVEAFSSSVPARLQSTLRLWERAWEELRLGSASSRARRPSGTGRRYGVQSDAVWSLCDDVVVVDCCWVLDVLC